MNPYISIIIPAYNEEDKIKDTLENIKDINEINEILVIDDGSSDKTTEIANSIESEKIKERSSNIFVCSSFSYLLYLSLCYYLQTLCILLAHSINFCLC